MACEADPWTPAVPPWYHHFMAMNLRLPDDLDARLDELARTTNESKSSLIAHCVRDMLDSAQHQKVLDATFDRIIRERSALLRRLEDA